MAVRRNRLRKNYEAKRIDRQILLPLLAAALLGTVSRPALADIPPSFSSAPVFLAQVDEVKPFSIAPQPIATALDQFSRQSGITVAYSAIQLAGIRSPGVNGAMTPRAALRALLTGSGVEFVFTSDDAVTLERSVADKASGPLRLEQIIVTGERRERTLRNTSSSVTVYGESELERVVGKELNDVLHSTSNVSIKSLSETPNIRGLEGGGPGGIVNTALAGTLPRVPLILDGVPQPASVPNASFSSLWDVEQVEILKGPQTTFHGRSSIAGAIVVKTKDPTFETEAAGESTLEIDSFGGPTHITNGMVSAPVFEDRLALRGTFEHRSGEDPRSVVNSPAGTPSDFLNEFDSLRFRTKALLTPEGEAGPLRLLASFDYQDGRTPQTRGTVQLLNFSDGVDRDETDREIDFATGALRLFDDRAWTTSLNASYDVGSVGKATSITSYSSTTFITRPDQPDNTHFNFRERAFNQDFLLELGGPTSSASGLLGANISTREQDIFLDNITNAFIGFATSDGNTRSASLFADARVGLLEDLDLHVGGRLLWNDDSRTSFTSISPFAVRTTQFSRTETVFLPSLGLGYDIDAENTVYVTVRQGWNAGGSAINFANGEIFVFDAETVWTGESTYRFESTEKRWAFNATAFFNLHEDPQFFVQKTPGNLATAVVENQGEGRSYGLELDARAALFDDLDIFGGLGLLHTEITEANAEEPDTEGNRFGRDPSVTLNLGTEWRPRFIDGLSVDTRVTYVGESFNDFENIDGQEIGDYILTDIGVSYVRDNVRGRLFITNILDEAGITARVGNRFAAVTPPRTYGLSLKVVY